MAGEGQTAAAKAAAAKAAAAIAKPAAPPAPPTSNLVYLGEAVHQVSEEKVPYAVQTEIDAF